jgi:GxxExxY protein
MLTKVKSPLPPEVEDCAYRVIGCLLTVHQILGPGFKEIVYKRAVCLELDAQGIEYECEKKILVPYKTWQIPGQTIDILVQKILILELKALPRLRDMHRRQVVSYLKATDLRLGLLANFNVPILKGNIKRIVRQKQCLRDLRACRGRRVDLESHAIPRQPLSRCHGRRTEVPFGDSHGPAVTGDGRVAKRTKPTKHTKSCERRTLPRLNELYGGVIEGKKECLRDLRGLRDLRADAVWRVTAATNRLAP